MKPSSTTSPSLIYRSTENISIAAITHIGIARITVQQTPLHTYLLRDHSLRLNQTLRDSFENFLEVATAIGCHSLVLALSKGEDVRRDRAGFLPNSYVEEGAGEASVVARHPVT